MTSLCRDRHRLSDWSYVRYCLNRIPRGNDLHFKNHVTGHLRLSEYDLEHHPRRRQIMNQFKGLVRYQVILEEQNGFAYPVEHLYYKPRASSNSRMFNSPSAKESNSRNWQGNGPNHRNSDNFSIEYYTRILKKCLNTSKNMSIACLFDILDRVVTVGNVTNLKIDDKYITKEILKKLIAEDLLDVSEKYIRAVTDMSIYGRNCEYSSRQCLDDYKLELKPILNYPSMNKNDILGPWSISESLDLLYEIAVRRTKEKVAIDTEGIYEDDNKTSLISICDLKSELILIIRLTGETKKGVQNLVKSLRKISEYRGFVSYGEENFLKKNRIHSKNIQRFDRKGQTSLANAVEEELHKKMWKTETNSNWQVDKLRKDQITYSAADAYFTALLYLHNPYYCNREK